MLIYSNCRGLSNNHNPSQLATTFRLLQTITTTLASLLVLHFFKVVCKIEEFIMVLVSFGEMRCTVLWVYLNLSTSIGRVIVL
jgi:hypothetical protein